MNSPCYCGKSNTYKECCGAFHSGDKKAETAEELMRSRYSAFVCADIDYIIKTYAARTRPITQEKEILDWAKSVKWQRLEVLGRKDGDEKDNQGFVEFKAYYKENGIDQCLHENSYFERENDQWVYVSGKCPNEEIRPKLLNRNDPCYCGSGRKFKKCCFGKT